MISAAPSVPPPEGGSPAVLARDAERVESTLAALAGGVVCHPRLRPALEYALGTRGKRLRPVLCAAAFRAVAGAEPSEAVYRLACAVELVHSYSLIHDDLPCMDDDDVRRGRPTLHRAFGIRTALLAGAALLPAAVQLLDASARTLGFDAGERGEMTRVLCAAAGAAGMVGGQFRDLRAEAASLSASELESIHRGKTGALLAGSLQLGGMAARGGARAVTALVSYGESLGLAFQIVDDLLDVEGDAATLGKAAGRDAVLRKSTYPALFGMDGARALAADRAAEARAALEAGGVRSPELVALAGYVLHRRS